MLYSANVLKASIRNSARSCPLALTWKPVQHFFFLGGGGVAGGVKLGTLNDAYADVWQNDSS